MNGRRREQRGIDEMAGLHDTLRAELSRCAWSVKGSSVKDYSDSLRKSAEGKKRT